MNHTLWILIFFRLRKVTSFKAENSRSTWAMTHVYATKKLQGIFPQISRFPWQSNTASREDCPATHVWLAKDATPSSPHWYTLFSVFPHCISPQIWTLTVIGIPITPTITRKDISRPVITVKGRYTLVGQKLRLLSFRQWTCLISSCAHPSP